ncbi:MAG: Nif3-like dinuclear metal center hexameric protein [Thermodesulfobacteriota bacterium]
MKLDELVNYTSEYLSLKDIKDYPNAVNGLQVEGSEEVEKIMTAVDGSSSSINAAAKWGADMLIVHHGILWNGLKPIVGPLKARLAPLIKNDISLYSAHLPLDAHPDIGNNAVLADLIGLEVTDTFGEYQGIKIGVYGSLDITLEELTEKVETALDTTVNVVPSGSNKLSKVAIVSGGGADSIAEAYDMGIDTLLTGECSHQEYIEAEELGINVIYAGHYATETVGVRALGTHLAEKFGIEHKFFDYPTGL